MVRTKRTSCSDVRADAAHDRDDIKAALLPNLEAETWPTIDSMTQRVSKFIFYPFRVSCSKTLVASGKREEICLYLAVCEFVQLHMNQFLRLKIRLTRTPVRLRKDCDWDYGGIVSRLRGSTVRLLSYGEGPGPMNMRPK
jgi:hypothetical protein